MNRVDAFPPAQRPERAARAAGESVRPDAPPRKVCTRRTRPVGGQLAAGRRSGELLLASSPAAAASTSPCSHSPLPDGVVGVLDGQLRQRRGSAPRRRRRRAGRQLATSTPIDQPSETMWCMVSSRTCSSSPSRSSVARSSGPCSGRRAVCASARPAATLPLSRSPAGSARQVHDRQRHTRRRRDDLHRLAHPQRRTWCAAPRAGARSRPGAAPARPRPAAPQPVRGRDVVGRAVRLELVEEPQPLLGKGEGEGTFPWNTRRDGIADAALQFWGRAGVRRQVLSQTGYGRPLEKTAQRYLHLECVTRTRDNAGSQRASARQAQRNRRESRPAPAGVRSPRFRRVSPR